jgi:hypothetical protein
MRSYIVTGFAVSAALLLSGVCGAADNEPDARRDLAVPAQTAPQPPGSSEFSVRDKESKDKDKRANTPPGMDRSGGGPASGAIVDPEGVVARNPPPRER